MSSQPASSAHADRSIRFYLNGHLQEVEVQESCATVLNYLRETQLQTGSKEGCAEGDCGACTVVMAEIYQRRIRFRAINACIQFLPGLDGKAIFTVEGLRTTGQALHPVQQALVDSHGSQCGFCTPGFVMSLFALYKSVANPSREQIDDALAGNLCRCTGYRPIIAAANLMYEYAHEVESGSQPFLRRPASEQAAREAACVEELCMLTELEQISAQQDRSFAGGYFAPTSLASLGTLLQTHPQATLLAGGTDIGLWVTKQYRELPLVIYLGQIEALKAISVEAGFIRIAAGVSLNDAFDVLLRYYPHLAEIVRRFASPPIRNAGTLCGNVANGSPIGDSMPALMCLGTILELRCGEDKRDLSLDNFYLGYQQKDLQAGEFIEALRIPLPDADTYFRSYKIAKRFDQDISALCFACSLQLRADKVAKISICYGGMAATVAHAKQAEAALIGKAWQLDNIEQAIAALAMDFTPLDDMRASAAYRLQVAGNLLLRFYHELKGADATTISVMHYRA